MPFYAPSGHSVPEQEILKPIMTAPAKMDIGIFPSFSDFTLEIFILSFARIAQGD
ncbi:hypothetical protein ADIMK_2371 [Marinobacterium lacunae]|uniref:Uncharacterized protein n=1 Tax=Marinobacterium lacunae TaxID=1232683 RepID=A0A081FYI7_9GAMM|nr:hypothetical protein ADIMK_2371 [Marinobacterium lacunae]